MIPRLEKRSASCFLDSVTVLREPGTPEEVGSAEEASQLAGFEVRMPQEGPEVTKISVDNGMAFNMVVNREQAQAILDSTGHEDLQLPENIDGAEIGVDVPRGVAVNFGECRSLEGDTTDPDNQDEVPAEVTDCVRMIQLPSPTVTAPDGIDLQQLAEIGLQFAGVDAQEAKGLLPASTGQPRWSFPFRTRKCSMRTWKWMAPRRLCCVKATLNPVLYANMS